MSHETSKHAFFRQSGWMVMASFLGGVFMFAVHAFAPVLGDAEYSLFGTLLAIINVLAIPSLGLQTTFAQQAAAAVTSEQKARLAGTVRGLLGLTFLIWLGFVVVVLGFRSQILGGLVITNPAALWLVLLIGLGSLWQPILYGVLQGRQDFLWLGWASIAGGLGRFTSVAVIVLLFGGRATGAVGGAVLGMAATVLLAGGRSRMVWTARERLPTAWTEWLWQTFLLSLGLGAWQFIFSVDMILVRYLFGEEQTGYYSASGMLARGMVMFTAPIAAVMFPKVVRSIAHGGEGRVLAYTLGTTGLLGALGAGGCTLIALAIRFTLSHPEEATRLLPAIIVGKILANRPGMGVMAGLIPWFAWCMLPLVFSNVLLQNLLARKRYWVVPVLMLTLLLYLHAEAQFGTSFLRVIQILGVFNLVFLAVLGLATFLEGRKRQAAGAMSAPQTASPAA
jgi:O-antigen/teichoic acid export membrane protein